MRWTGAEDRDASWPHVLEELRARTGLKDLSSEDFVTYEDRQLARSRFRMYLQVSRRLPIEGMSVRVWSNPRTDELIQLEARLDGEMASLYLPLAWDAAELAERFGSEETLAIARKVIEAHPEDPRGHGATWRDVWAGTEPVRIVRLKGARGVHTIRISLLTGEVLGSSYHRYARFRSGELPAIPVQVFPVYEEVEGHPGVLPRLHQELRYLRSEVRDASNDPYAALRSRRYLEEKEDPVLGELPAGQSRGKWSMASVARAAAAIRARLPWRANSFASGDVSLVGRFAEVGIHPGAWEAFGPFPGSPNWSAQFVPDWAPFDRAGHLEMIPRAALRGAPLLSREEAWNRPARRLSDHNPAEYIRDGFDELQVYFAITRFFEALIPLGFTDPEYSQTPFSAVLYNPDPTMRDNAFYADGTVHFTTYTPGSPNYARDNPTIWHELGHGLMDRLMGNQVEMPDGLAEGVADFVSDVVVNDVTGGKPYPGSGLARVLNRTGFFLTNEEHDDGEAYGGVLKDLLNAAIAQYGRVGPRMVTDLVLETMRLCRNHPELTAASWFEHLFFADSLGSPGVRAPAALAGLLSRALLARNFDVKGGRAAQFLLFYDGKEVTADGLGSRERPVTRALGKSSRFKLEIGVRNGDAFHFRFPVTARVLYRSGPLQGPIHWDGEEAARPLNLVIGSERDRVAVDLSTSGKCDAPTVAGCTDYVYVELWNAGERSKPQGKKRFYLRLR